MKAKLVLSIVLVVILSALVASVALAAPVAAPTRQDPSPQIPTLVEFLTLLTTTVGLGMVVSFELAQLERFQNVSAQVKFLLVLATCLILPVGAQLVISFVPAETLTALEPFWKALAAGFAVFIGSQVFYTLVLKKGNLSG